MYEGPEPEYADDEHVTADATAPFQINCAFCDGTGVHPGTMNSLTHHPCPACRGKGVIYFHTGRENFHTCSQCDGSGRQLGQTLPEPCEACGGSGMIKTG